MNELQLKHLETLVEAAHRLDASGDRQDSLHREDPEAPERGADQAAPDPDRSPDPLRENDSPAGGSPVGEVYCAGVGWSVVQQYARQSAGLLHRSQPGPVKDHL